MNPPSPMTGDYDAPWVAASFLIAGLASFTALTLARRVAQSEGASAWRWLFAGALSMGIGIWAMHFVGMLALRMQMAHTYDVGITVLSIGVGILSSGLALFIGSRKQLRPTRLVVGGLVMGAGIAAMHYTGMAAMEMPATIRYEPGLFAASILVAVVAATAAMWLTFQASSREAEHIGYRILAAIVMALAVCGMHYTGMAAARFIPLPGVHAHATHGLPWLELSVTVASLVILLGTLLASYFDYKIVVQRQVEKRLTEVIAERTQELTRTVHRLEQALVEAETARRHKDAFLSNMSHELRTPLTAILGFTELLREVVSEEGQEFVDIIEAGGQRLKDTLTSVLELSQLQAGPVELYPVALDVAQMVEETATLLRKQAAEKGLTMQVTFKDPIPALMDRAALNRILTNLAGNAVKFTDPGGRVSMAATVDDGQVVLTVADTGIGISPEFLPHLFNEFMQESTGLARSHEGNGLGMAITKRLVDIMGGTISVESRKEHGTTFTVRLPHVPVIDTGREDRSADRLGSPKHRVLLVEDDASTRAYVKRALSGARVTEAVSAEGALQAARIEGSPWGVVLLDINLGAGPSGLDILGELRAMPACEDACFVAMTAYALPGDRERFLEAGFDYYLAKPFTLAELADVCVVMAST